MKVRMTRRDLAAVLGSAAAVATGRAQTAPALSEDLNTAAKDEMRKNVEAMAKVDLADSVEPAFLFKA